MTAKPTALSAIVRTIHTLGGPGTNCESAAGEWYRRNGVSDGRVLLHPTLEDAVEALGEDPGAALLSCIVYPELHTLVFSNLHRLQLADSFIMPTYHMVLAARGGPPLATVATHPAPQGLVPAGAVKTLVNSNVEAAEFCAAGRTDGCITTQPAMERHGLRLVTDFGAVPMGFALHTPIRQPAGRA